MSTMMLCRLSRSKAVPHAVCILRSASAGLASSFPWTSVDDQGSRYISTQLPPWSVKSIGSQRRFSSSDISSETLTKPKHFVPRSERSADNQVFKLDSCGDRLVKVNRVSPTRELNYSPRAWQLHKDPWRRTRHLKGIFRSSPFRRLLVPDLAINATVAIGLSYYNAVLVPNTPGLEMITMDGSAMAGATTAVGLLAAFRLNASYGRYDEARKFWGEINNCSRDLAGETCMWLDGKENKERMIKLIQAFPVALQWHLNEKGGFYSMERSDPDFEEQKNVEFIAEMNDIYQDVENPDYVQITTTYKSRGHVPLAITSLMRLLIANNSDAADPIYNRAMDSQVERLVGCTGMCERVLRTPIPTCFTRHTSRLFFLWSNLIPFAVYSSLGPIATMPVSLLASWSILAIGDVGVQLEEPFNILPLRQYSEGIYDGINSIEASYMLGSETTSTDVNN